MKTTVDITDSLLVEAKAVARQSGLTLKELIEKGLRYAIGEQMKPKRPFALKDGSVQGEGLVGELSWPEIRRSIYEGRGE